jgi:hypothetical protein
LAYNELTEKPDLMSRVMNVQLANIFGPEHWMLIALVALLLFGRRLPEVWKSIGGTNADLKIVLGIGIAFVLFVYLFVRHN